VVIKSLGRGISETTIPSGEDIDAALLAKIRTEDQPEVDAFEAQKVVEQLATCDVDDVVQEGDRFRVTTRVMGGTTVHLVGMPTQKDVVQYRRSFARVLDMPFGKQEVTINITAAADLYKKLIVATEGYAGDIPVIHQAVAVKAAIDYLDTSLEEDREANF
jgi:hypothetical protein